MALSSGAHVAVGETEFLLDEAYEALTGRRCYSHGGRSVFAEQFAIAGETGKSVRQDRLLWYTTRFAGEGQVVLDGTDADAAALFYRSEGINFKTPGQGKLNKSTLAQTITVGGPSTSTYQGNADFTDVVGTSTGSGDDRRLNATSDKIASTANFAPGATNCQADFYVFREPFSDYGTTIQGSAFIGGQDVATDKRIHSGVTIRSAKLTGFTAGVTQRVEFFLYTSNGSAIGTPDLKARIYVMDVTEDNSKKPSATMGIVYHKLISDASSPTNANFVLTFKPTHANRVYRIFVEWPGGYRGFDRPAKDTALLLDKIIYGNEVSANNVVTIEVYDQSGGATLKTKKFQVQTHAKGKIAGSITWDAVAATNYRFRVTRGAGKQRIWVDKVIATAKATPVFTLDCLDFGVGQKVWLGAHTGAADSKGFVYNTSTNIWDDTVTFNDATATTGAVVISMAHSDILEYFLLNINNGQISHSTSAGVDTKYAYFSAAARTLRAITVCQNRLVALAEDSTGVRVYSIALDSTAGLPIDLTALTTFIDITVGQKSPDANLRHRMCSTPTGARFFVNFSDATTKIYEVDTSGAQLAQRELGDLGAGVKATSIAYESGITFVCGLYYGEAGTVASATDVDRLARPALWVIDQNGVVQRVGFFRRDDPAAGPPIAIVPFQTDVYVLQSGLDAAGVKRSYVWRYSLVTGGLYLEYELPPDTVGNHRSLAVIPGRVFAQFSDEVFVTGSDGTYRSASVEDGNSVTTSIYDYDLPVAVKTLVKVEVLTTTMPANTTVAVEYQLDGSGTWNLLGTATSGTRNTFAPNGEIFNTIQFRVTLGSLDGISTPVLLALVAEARASEDEEYFDLVLLTEDADSNYRTPGDQQRGDDKAQALIDLWRTGAPTTFLDGYTTTRFGEYDTYQVTVGDLRDERTKQGEGRLVTTLKVVR